MTSLRVRLLAAVTLAAAVATCAGAADRTTGPSGSYTVVPKSVTLGNDESAVFTVAGDPLERFDWSHGPTAGIVETLSGC